MLIKITLILWQVSFVVLQATSTEDEAQHLSSSPQPSTLSSISTIPSENSDPPSTSTSETLPTGTFKVEKTIMWSLEFLNYSSVCSLYDNNAYYLTSAKDNVKLIYHFVVARFLSLFTILPSFSESDRFAFVSRFSTPALSYHLYSLQTLLFRIETIAIICICFILALFLHSRFYYRERHRLVEAASFSNSPQSATSFKSNHFFATIFHYFNFIHVYRYVDAVLKNFRSPEAIIVQLSHGHTCPKDEIVKLI